MFTVALTHKCKYKLILEVYFDTKIKDMCKKPSLRDMVQ